AMATIHVVAGLQSGCQLGNTLAPRLIETSTNTTSQLASMLISIPESLPMRMIRSPAGSEHGRCHGEEVPLTPSYAIVALVRDLVEVRTYTPLCNSVCAGRVRDRSRLAGTGTGPPAITSCASDRTPSRERPFHSRTRSTRCGGDPRRRS